MLNYGAPEGIGGVASYWMCFLQQAGGKLYGEDGMPAFNNEAGIAGLQVMVDLMPYTDPGSISYVGINDATNVLLAGNASMMMNWPFMWKPAQDPANSKIVGKLAGALLPAGPAGTASIDGTDAWTIAATQPNPEQAQEADRVLSRSRGAEAAGASTPAGCRSGSPCWRIRRYRRRAERGGRTGAGAASLRQLTSRPTTPR